MIRIGMMEQKYESWADRATKVYIYMVVAVTITVYVCYVVWLVILKITLNTFILIIESLVCIAIIVILICCNYLFFKGAILK